ncbi:hypothetical protein AVEN_116998-1 [Araneus ventricosus]|uniref:Transposase Tc1-like domain-containing protein n=1 Tax=Araneus ventricosus TaxID=182803 RepID=A0A4Y2PR00_ARAVE|nr:hypothetical protein AVEN_116998-1 [Araneus ventricosus]
MGSQSRRPTRVPLLTARYNALRLSWARQHYHWTADDWKDQITRFYRTNGSLEACLNGMSQRECTLRDAKAIFSIPKRIICHKRRPTSHRKQEDLWFSPMERKRPLQLVVQIRDVQFKCPVHTKQHLKNQPTTNA